MRQNDTFYAAIVKPTRIAVVLYTIVKQILYTLYDVTHDPGGYGWLYRLVTSAALVIFIYAVTGNRRLTRKQIAFLVMFVTPITEIIFYVLVGGDRLIFPFLIGCALLSIMYGEVKSTALALGITYAAFAVILFVFDINVVGAIYETGDSIYDYASVIVICVIAILIGKYTIGTLDTARLEAEAATKIKGDLLARVEANMRTFRIFYEVSHELASALTHEKIFKAVAHVIPRVAPACSRALFLLRDNATGHLRIRHIAGEAGELAVGMEWKPDTRGIYSYAFNSPTVVNIFNLQEVGNYRFAPDEPTPAATKSLIVIPLLDGDECAGLFSAESADSGVFLPELEQQLKTLMENTSLALARVRLYRSIEMQAITDSLTELNNRRHFDEKIIVEFQRAKRYGRALSLLMIDVDRFKNFNDTYGHLTGDRVLREIAAVIRGIVRNSDFPARYGGEEFAVILPETTEPDALMMAERIRLAVEACVITRDTEKLRVTISVGGVTYPNYCKTEQEIIDRADCALYASKRKGRNQVSMYNKEIALWEAFENR